MYVYGDFFENQKFLREDIPFDFLSSGKIVEARSAQGAPRLTSDFLVLCFYLVLVKF